MIVLKIRHTNFRYRCTAPQAFHDLSLYYNYLISVLRLQNGYQNFNNINYIFRVSLFVKFSLSIYMVSHQCV